MKIRYADCYAGIGGFAVGLREAIQEIDPQIVLENVVMSETKALCIKQYNHIFDLKHDFVGLDMNKSDFSTGPDMDVIFAGFPCPPYSQAGALKGLQDERSDAIFRLIDLVRIKQPKWFLFENVSHFVNFDEKRIYGFFVDQLRQLGYHIDPKPLILNVRDFGIPQNRARVYIIGIRKDVRFNDMIFQHLGVKPDIPLLYNYQPDEEVDKKHVLCVKNQHYYFYVLYGGDRFLQICKEKRLELPRHLFGFVFYDDNGGEDNKDIDGKVSDGQKSIKFYQKHKDGIDPGMKEFKFIHGPSSLQQLITPKDFDYEMKNTVIQFRQSGFRVMRDNVFPTFAHNVQHTFIYRKTLGGSFITDREYLRLQGFPEGYTGMKKASRSFVHNSIGNAVNVEVVKFICKLVIKSIIKMG